MSNGYIGITGFMNHQEAAEVVRELYLSWMDIHHDLALGILVSDKTARGEANNWPGSYPKIDDVASIFVQARDVHNVVHYYTSRPEKLAKELLALENRFSAESDLFDGFQLNLVWPDVEQLRKYHEKATYRHERMILELGPKALEEMGYHPERICDRLENEGYLNVISDVLYDASAGLGIPLNVDKVEAFLKAAKRFEGSIGVGIAGGLSTANLPAIAEFCDKYPHLSLDAQGQLRTPLDQPRTNSLDVWKAVQYVRGTIPLFIRRFTDSIQKIPWYADGNYLLPYHLINGTDNPQKGQSAACGYRFENQPLRLDAGGQQFCPNCKRTQEQPKTD